MMRREREEEEIQPAGPATSSSASDLSHSPFFREYVLLLEYKHLKTTAPSGVYVMPSFDTLLEWHGVIFLRQGLYRNAIFKFLLTIPESYPNARPSVRFISKVYHPQVVVATGLVDLSHAFPTWVPQHHHICHILIALKRMFYHIDPRGASNAPAARLLVKERSLFQKKVEACVQLSLGSVMTNLQGTSLRFYEWNNQLQSILRRIIGGDDHGGMSCEREDVGRFASWLGTSVTRNVGF